MSMVCLAAFCLSGCFGLVWGIVVLFLGEDCCFGLGEDCCFGLVLGGLLFWFGFGGIVVLVLGDCCFGLVLGEDCCFGLVLGEDCCFGLVLGGLFWFGFGGVVLVWFWGGLLF